MQWYCEGDAQRAAPAKRRGTALVLAAVCLIVIMAMVALSVDLGYMAMAKAQLQNAADAAALAGSLELYEGLGPNPSNATASTARGASVDVAALNPAAGLGSVSLKTSNIELGRRTWNESGGHVDAWGAGPYNLIRVTALRDSSSSDGPIATFFAGTLGQTSVDLSAQATVVVHSASGFEGTAPILPIAYDLLSWNLLLAGIGGDGDNHGWNGHNVNGNSDGVPEFNLYPNGSATLPPGNRGTVNFGADNNSTSDLNRQIRDGLSETDLAEYGGQISLDDGPMTLTGDPGVSAGIQHSLEKIVGETRCIPVFSTVTGSGGNATYTIVKFVGVRIMEVNLHGGNKQLLVQPVPLVFTNAIPSTNGSSTFDYVFTPPKLTN
jgi:Flp pilus assembly protein TadG